MKPNFIATLAIICLLTACKGTSTSANDILANSDDTTSQDGTGGSSQPRPGQPPASPFNYDSAIFESNGQETKFTYVEVLEHRNPALTTLIFYTRAPRGMCNLSTLFDSSEYQTNFKFLKLTIDQSTLGEKTITNATFGTRGDTFPRETTVRGKAKLISKADHQYQGWINLSGPKFELRGNFDVGACAKTESSINRLKLNRIYQTVNLVDTHSNRISPILLSTNYTKYSYGDYEGYVNDKQNLSVSIATNTDAYEKFRIDFYGIASGDFLSLGNMIGSRHSPGPGIAAFEGNALIINDSTKPHMTDDPQLTAGPKVKIEYFSATDKHKITIYLQEKELMAEFQAK